MSVSQFLQYLVPIQSPQGHKSTINYAHLHISMKVIKYNKLIRDKIPQIIKRDNAIPKISILNHRRFAEELKKKLVEESAELQKANSKKELLNELSDVLEILQTIARAEKLKWNEIEKKRVIKAKERGGFQKRIFLKEVKELD